MSERSDTPGRHTGIPTPGHDPRNPTGTREAAEGAAGKAKAEGAELLGEARHRAEEVVEDGKAKGAEHASGFARAIRHAADDLEEESPDIARHVRAMGDSIGGMADAMRDRSAGQLLEDVKGFAQRQPTLFFGAAALAGFALVRFARSSARDSVAREAHTSGDRPATRPSPDAPGTSMGTAQTPPRPAATPASTGPQSSLATPAVQSGSMPTERSGTPL